METQAAEVQAAPEWLSADDILSAQDTTIAPVDVPEWRGKVYVRTISAAEREAWERRMQKLLDENMVRASFVVLCACDANGNRLFGDDKTELLSRKSFAATARVFNAARKLNGLDDEAAEQAKNG